MAGPPLNYNISHDHLLASVWGHLRIVAGIFMNIR